MSAQRTLPVCNKSDIWDVESRLDLDRVLVEIGIFSVCQLGRHLNRMDSQCAALSL